MYRYAFVMLVASVIGCLSCTKDKPAAPSTKHDAGESCDLPPLRRSMPRFLPGIDCPTVETVPEHAILPLEVRLQQCTLWCWGASLSALASYNGQAFQPCEIAGMGTGKECCVMDPCGTPGCNKTLPSAQVSVMLEKVGIGSEYLNRPLTELELKQEIASGRPVLIVSLNADGGQHMSIAYGYDHVQFSVMDPAPGGWRGTTGFGMLQGDPNGPWHWDETWRIRSKKPGACPVW